MSDRNLLLLTAIGLIVVLGLLAGCDQTPTPTPSPTATAASEATPTTLALSPSLDDGKHHIFIGTAVGEFWALDPAAMIWEPLPD